MTTITTTVTNNQNCTESVLVTSIEETFAWDFLIKSVGPTVVSQETRSTTETCNGVPKMCPLGPDPETPDPETPDPETPDPETPDPETPDPESPDSENPDPEKPEKCKCFGNGQGCCEKNDVKVNIEFDVNAAGKNGATTVVT